MMNRLRRVIGSIDRLGGLLIYRTVGTFAAFLAVVSALVSGDLLTADGHSAGNRIAGVVLAIVSLLLVAAAGWCFSPRRRLSDLE